MSLGRGAGVALVMLTAVLGATGCSDGRRTVELQPPDVPEVGEEVANQPLTVMVALSPALPRAGEAVTFRVRAEDPDAPIPEGSCFETYHWFGDEQSVSTGCTPGCAAPPEGAPEPRYAPEPGVLEEELRHTYERPGTYQAVFGYSSKVACAHNPYGSSGKATVTVTVRP